MNTNLRSKALSGLAWRIAHENIGIYAKAVHGDGGYEQRTERMEGWNECAMAHSKHASTVKKWLKQLPDDCRGIVEDLLLDSLLDLSIRDDTIELEVNCSDLFFWGCSDCEPIEIAELTSLNSAIGDAKAAGAEHGGELLWVARKREMRPQGAYYAHVAPELGKLFDACGPYRPAEFGNPVASSFEDGEAYREKRKHSR